MINDPTPIPNDDYKNDPLYKAAKESQARVAQRRKAEPGTSLSPAEAGGGSYYQNVMDTTVGPVTDFGLEAIRYVTDVAPAGIYSLTGGADEATGGYLSAAFNGVVGLMAKYDAAPVGRKFPKASEFADAAIDAQIQSMLEGPNVFLEMGNQGAKSFGFGTLNEEETRELFHDPDGTAREFGAVAGQGLTILMGGVGLAMMTSTAVGNSVDGYYQYTKDNDIEYDPMMGVGVGIIGGASEFVFNKMSALPVVRRFAFFGQEGIEKHMRASVNKAFIEAVKTGDPRVGARIIGTAIGGFTSEAAEEAVTEAVQTGMTLLYRGIDASNGGVTLDEVLEAAMKGAIYGGAIGSVAAVGGSAAKQRQVKRVGAESRALVESESATTAERQLLKDRLVASGLSESDATKMVQGIKGLRSERGARKKAQQEQAQVGEEADVQDLLNSAMGRKDATFGREAAVAEGVNRGELPSDADKEYILRGEVAETEEADDGPRPSAKLFGRNALNAIAKRLVERFPKLAATIRDEGRITEEDAALFLPEAEASEILKGKLVERISDQVSKASKSSKEREAEKRMAEELQLMLDAGVDAEGNPLSEAAKDDIRQQIADAIRAPEAAPEASGPSGESEVPLGPEPAPDASESAEDSAAAIAEMADGLGGIERLTDAAALDLAVKLGIEEDIDDRDQLNAAIKAKMSAAAEAAGPDRMSEEEQMAIEARIAELDTLGDEITVEQENELWALTGLSSSEESKSFIDGQLGDDVVARDQLQLLLVEYAESRDPEIAHQIVEILDSADGGSKSLLDLDPTDYDEDGNPIEMMSRETEEEAESPIDEDIAEEIAEEGVEEEAGIAKLKAAGFDVEIVSDEDAGPIARKAKDAMPFSEDVVFYRGDANAPTGFYDRETGKRYVKVSTQESARVESDGRTKAGKKLLRRILLEAYVQTMLHENIHARDIETDGKPGTIAAADKYLRNLHGSEEELDRLLESIQGSAEGRDRNRDRELRAETLTDREGMRRAGLLSLYDQDASIFQRTRDRLRRLMARRRGGTLENLIIRDFDAMSAEVTSSTVPSGRIEGDAADTEMQTRGRHDPNSDIRAIAASYALDANIDYDESKSREGVVSVDTDRARVIADMFDSAPDSFADPKMVESHKAMAREVIAQYKALRDAGYQMIPWGSQGQPYRNSREMMQDVRDNKRIYYYKTLGEQDSFGSGQVEMDQLIKQNPLLRKAGGTVLDSEGVPHVQLVNDLFRAVHDIFGHAKEGHQFGPRGEENAWRQHVQMFTPAARAAMTSETRGQNSWVNYGPHLRREDGTLPELSDPDFVHPKDRPYSEQKIVKFPSWVTAEKGLDVEDWPDRPEVEYQERGKHVGGVGSRDDVVTEDLRDFVSADLRAGGVPLPYEPGQEPSLALGTVAHDRSLRDVRVIYPVGTFTQEDMEKIRDQAIEDIRTSSPLAIESASRAFVNDTIEPNHVVDLSITDDPRFSFPVVDPKVINDSFADQSLREDKRFWYEASGDAVRNRTIFSPTNDIRKISDLLSATSPLTPVLDNFYRAYAIAADYEGKGYSQVSLPTPQLSRRAIAGEYEGSNSYKASSFGDTMAFLAGDITELPMSTNDIWVAYMFGMRVYNSDSKDYTGDNKPFNNPYAYLYAAVYNARLAEEINRRIRGSQEFAEASERAADRSATLADESLLTPWTPWQIQAYPWSHLSDSGTFDEAMDSAIGLLELNGSESVITLDDGTKGIDLNVAATEDDFSKILQPSVEAKEAAAVSLEVGGPFSGKGSERSLRRAIDAALKADDSGEAPLAKSEREALLKARYAVYKVINKMLGFLAGNKQGGDVYQSRTQLAEFLAGKSGKPGTTKGNPYINGLYAALLRGPLLKASRDQMMRIAQMREAGADPEMIDALEAEFAERSLTMGVSPNPTAGFDTTRDTLAVGGQTDPQPTVDPETGKETLDVRSGARIYNLNWGLRKTGSGVGGYFEGVVTPNLKLNMYAMEFDQQDMFMSLLGYALGEKSIGMSRPLAPTGDIKSQELGEREVFATVLTTQGVEISADKLGRLNRYVEENPHKCDFVFWNMQTTATGTMIVVVNDHLPASVVEEIENEIGIELRYSPTTCETNLISANAGKDSDGNYNGEQILKEMIDEDIAEESEWRKALSEREAEAIGTLNQGQLRRLLEARGRLRSTRRSVPGRVPAAVAAAIGKSRAFRVHHAVQGIKSRNERFHREVAEAVESVRETVENIGIEFQRRDSDPASPQFKAWFGNSVLTDAEGMPAVFYHGTGSPEDFNVFDVKGRQGATVYGAGAYFTDDPTTANSFAKYSYHGAEAGQRVIPAYIRIEKPFVFDRSDEKFLERIGARSRGGRAQTHLLKAFEDKHPDYDTSSIREILTSLISIDTFNDPDNESAVAERQFNMAMQNAMRAVGHDGVVVIAPRPSRPNERYAIPFDPNQIKGIFNEKPTGRPEIDMQRRQEVSTEEFRNWFGESKITNADGSPKVVYHGTDNDFREFKASPMGAIGSGVYFAEDPEVAYGRRGGSPGNRTIPVYLRIANPFITKDRVPFFDDTPGKQSIMTDLGERHPDMVDRIDENSNIPKMKERYEDANKIMRDAGYDGLIVTHPTRPYKQDEYVVFDPEQAKSSIVTSDAGPTLSSPLIDMQRRETIVLDRKIGMGAVPDQSGGSYFMTKMMTAKEFLAMVPPAEPDERTDAIEQKLRNGEPVSPPFLNVEWDEKNGYWEITGHEGRHRAQAMHRVEWGVKFPVDMFVRGNFNKYEQVETEDGRTRNQRRRPTQAELVAPVRPQRGSKKSKSGLVTVLPERAEDPRTLVLSREGRDQLAAEVPALVRSSLALAGDFQVEGKNGNVSVAAVVDGKLQVIVEYPYNANTNPGDVAIAAVERLIALDQMDSLSDNIRSQIEDSRSPLQTFMNEEPTDADEAMLEYMRRNYSGIEKPIKSWGEELKDEGGIGIGHNARAFGRFIRSHTIEMFQDEWYPITETIRRIQEVKGSRIAEKQDPMQLIRLAPGQSAEQARQFSTRTMNRIKKRMKSAGINNEQIGRFMAANHALERNARIREVNSVRAEAREELGKLNCGISDETANRLLEEHAADPKAAEIEEICVDFQEISFETAKIAKYAGLITNEDFDRITTRYKYYVPMNVTGSENGTFITDPVDAAMDKVRRSKGSSGVGTVIDIATGRRDKLKYSLGRPESEVTVKAIVRGAAPALFVDRVMTQNEAITSRIANRLLRMAEKYPTAHISIVTTKDLEKRVMHKEEGQKDRVVVKKMEPDPQTMIPVRIEETREIDGVLYERGETIYLKINDELLIKKLDAGQDMSRNSAVVYLLFSPARIFTSMLRFTSTQWMSVDFTIRQPLLDGETALIAASEQGLMNPNQMRKQMMKRMPAVLKTIARSEWRARVRPDLEADVTEENEALGPLAKEWQEFRDVGAKQQWFNSLTVDKTITAMERLSKSGPETNVREGAALMHRMFVETYSVLNDLGDNMWRFSYYVTLRENGMSAEEAGVMARNLTVDFSKKGSFGGPLSSVFAFFNATVQGNVRNYQQTMKGLYTGKGPARAVFGGLTAMGTLSAFAMMAIGGEDEDESGVPDYLEQIPEYERRRNIIIPWGRDDKGKIQYSKIPLQYGLEIPVQLGFGMVEVAYGVKNPLDIAGEVANSYATAFNPVSGTPMNSAHGLMRALLPDMGDAAIDVIANRSWTGRPVYYGDQPLQTGGAVRSEIGSAGERYGIDWNSTAKLINHLTGGDVAVRGAIDMQPQVWEYLAGTFGGSSLRNIERLAVLGIDLYKSAVFGDELPDAKGVPGLRKFIGKGPDNPYPTFYYEVRDRVRSAKVRMKAYEGDQPSMVKAVRDTVDGSPKMQAKAKSVESRLRKLKSKERDLTDKIRSLPRGTERARASDQLNRVKDQIAETMKSLIKAYVDAGGDL